MHQFPGYVTKLVTELYQSVEAVLKSRISGQGALSTLVLCESLLSFLPSGSYKDQPYRLLKGYDVVPLGTLELNRRINLRPYASLRKGALYISCPSAENIWVPLGSLSSSARATACQMLEFLKLLKESPKLASASTRAARIIVTRFKHDLFEMGKVRHMTDFEGARADSRIDSASSAEDYARKVFHPSDLPGEMSVKACLRMSLELQLPDLHKEIARELYRQAKMVPKATAHSGIVDFSPSALVLLMSGGLSDGNVDEEDAFRLVMAGTPLLFDHFPQTVQRKRKIIQKRRPRLARCVRRVVRMAWRKCGGTCKHLVAIACVVAVALADREGITGQTKTAVTSLSKRFNMYRYIKRRDIQHVIRHSDDPSDDESDEEAEEGE